MEKILTKDDLTPEIIDEIKKYFPNAEFVLDNTVNATTVSRAFSLPKTINEDNPAFKQRHVRLVMDPVTFQPVYATAKEETMYKMRIDSDTSIVRSISEMTVMRPMDIPIVPK